MTQRVCCPKCGGLETPEQTRARTGMTEVERQAVANGWKLEDFREAVVWAKGLRAAAAEKERVAAAADAPPDPWKLKGDPVRERAYELGMRTMESYRAAFPQPASPERPWSDAPPDPWGLRKAGGAR